MATRENQGLQIALIIFVMLTIILSVTTFLFFRNYQEEQIKSKSLQDSADKNAAAASTAVEESNTVKERMLGISPQTSLADVTKKFESDMQAFGANVPPTERTYPKVLGHTDMALKTSQAQTVDTQAREKQLTDKLALEVQQRQKEIAKYQEALVQSDADRDQERTKFNAERQKFVTDSGNIAQQMKNLNQRLDQQTAAAQGEIKKKETVIEDYRQRNVELKQRVKGQDVASAIPDGKVIWVNQSDQLVWVDIGSEDGLRRQILFSVIGRNENNPVKAEKKGSIEIVQIVGSHMAEARIVDDSISNPIMPGDQIFSPVWQVGRAERFALAGFMDIDDDEHSDRAIVRNLIVSNGGLIDAEVADDGKRLGKMSVNTSYLVLGDDPGQKKKKAEATLKPAEEETAPKSNEAAAGYTEFKNEALTLPVKTISLSDFLNHVGFKAEERTISLGVDAKESDFRLRFPDGRQRTAPTSDSFRPRRPAGTRPPTSTY